MKFALFCLIFGMVDGWVFGWLCFRERLRLMKEDRDYWFQEHEKLSVIFSIKLDRIERERDGADYWKEEE